MSLRTRLLVGSLGVATSGAVLVGLATAATAEEISALTVDAVVAADTTMAVTETIDYDFRPNARHGIYRDIPLFDPLVTGEERHYGVDVTSVRMDGASVPYELTTEGSSLRVLIGDANAFVTGVHEYVIAYRVRGALQSMTAADAAPFGGQAGDAELYWDFVGGAWEVPIATAQTTVTGPSDVLAVGCYFGPYGSEETCATRVSGAVADFGPVQLEAGSSLTGAAAWSASAFSTAIEQDIRPGPGASVARGAAVGGLLGAIAIVVMVAVALSRRRAGSSPDVAAAPPVYGPPCGLAPAEMVAALEGVGSTPTALMATYLDLAARGWLRISVEHGAAVLVRQDAGTDELRPWEASLMAATFGERWTATLGDFDPGLQSAWTFTGIRLVDAAESAGYRNPTGGHADRRWTWLGGIGAVVAGVSAVWLFLSGLAPMPAAGAVLGLCVMVGGVVAARLTPRTQTATSARFLIEVAGLRTVLGTEPAASRQRFAQESGLAPAAILATMLPYAVGLGLEDAWVSAFPELERAELNGFGLDVVSAVVLSGLVATGVTSSAVALTSPDDPSPSSGGSGLAGDGSAGGGGGGGGGGSW